MPDEAEVTQESLLNLARDFDAGKSIDPAPAAADATEAKPADKADESAADPVENKEANAEAAKPASEAEKSKSPQKTDAEKQKSKWAQNEERKAKTWQEINAEKEAIRAERERLQRERDEFQQKTKAPAEPLRDEHNASAADYREAAKLFTAKGDATHAAAAEKLAADLEGKEQAMRQKQALQEGQAKWTKNLTELVQKHPDLSKPDSPLSVAAMKVLETFPMLKRDPDGIKYAVRAAEIELQAKEFEGTKAEYAKLKAEHEKLQKKLSISGGSPTAPLPEAKTFDSMSQKERRASLEQLVAQHDRDNGL